MPDGSTTSFKVSIAGGLDAIARDDWDRLALQNGANPFVAFDFLRALEDADCVGPAAGWTPAHILVQDVSGGLQGAMPFYAKTNSYGEYVFDHAWADAMRRAGGRYYPKLQCASPFTPVTGPRLLARSDAVRRRLVQAALALCEQSACSSIHVTFETVEEQDLLASMGFLRRTGVQFHWENAGYGAFSDFLDALSSSKRKNIRKERERAQSGLTIRRLRGVEIEPADWDFFFRCYMDTGSRKWGTPYLNKRFFRLLGERMGEKCLLFIAEREGEPIASALNLLGSDTVFGRYWGCVENVPFLHFELCYYQAIEYAIEHGYARVEAGAQGEHKLLRGYAPVTTYSSHWIAHPGLRSAVAAYLAQERPAIADEIEALAEHTPFKKSDS